MAHPRKSILIELFNGAHRLISDICSNDDKKIWFIPCEDEESVYYTYPNIAARVLDECLAFEYALADKKLKWMFIESHHNVLYATGIEAIHCLNAYNKDNQPIG
ncbi:DUF6756 family protein [Desulfogranum japonicum]|uniref:DUF6756 family protein n=1 Tax=Desulfogranum japonicum TaxID=231447 RepID=UPI00048DB601